MKKIAIFDERPEKKDFMESSTTKAAGHHFRNDDQRLFTRLRTISNNVHNTIQAIAPAGFPFRDKRPLLLMRCCENAPQETNLASIAGLITRVRLISSSASLFEIN
ncbi:MAG: hypothetical protein SOX70_04265 [Peptoniphilaceae bacterium]|nr:hypothetical protein [Peptoniphilaceae bacterium]